MGEILTIEAVMLPGKGKMTITGKLGEVMQDHPSCEVFVQSRSLDFGVKPNLYAKKIYTFMSQKAPPQRWSIRWGWHGYINRISIDGHSY